jgi:hypothetical protein
VPQGYKCKMERDILALGISGIIMSANSVEAEVSGGEVKTAYGGLQRMPEDVAQGIEERQAEIKRMIKNTSGKHAELTTCFLAPISL